MVKGAPSSIGTAANVSTAADVRQASVQFPLAGDLDAGLGNVRVIDWNRPGLSARMTQTGPIAHQLGLDEEIETTIRTERMCGGCPASATDGQLMVEVMLGKRQSISGSSYTLALALADKIARGSLPLLADRTIVASGHVQRNGQVAPVGRLAEKLEVIARALARATISAPLLILPQANLAALTDAEQRLLDAVIAAGARSEGVAALSDFTADWPSSARAATALEMPRERAVNRRWIVLPVLGVCVLLGMLVLYQTGQSTDACARLPLQPDSATDCWEALPLSLQAECRLAHRGGYRPWRRCASGTCLAGADQFRLLLRPAADGWLHVFHLDTTDALLEDLWPDRKPRQVYAGESLRLPGSNRTYRIDGRSSQEHFFALLSRHPIPESSGSDAFAAELLTLLAKRGEQLTICRERIAYGH